MLVRKVTRVFLFAVISLISVCSFIYLFNYLGTGVLGTNKLFEIRRNSTNDIIQITQLLLNDGITLRQKKIPSTFLSITQSEETSLVLQKNFETFLTNQAVLFHYQFQSVSELTAFKQTSGKMHGIKSVTDLMNDLQKCLQLIKNSTLMQNPKTYRMEVLINEYLVNLNFEREFFRLSQPRNRQLHDTILQGRRSLVSKF